MAEETKAKTLAVIRKACEDARGKMVVVHADDVLDALEAASGKQPEHPDTIET